MYPPTLAQYQVRGTPEALPLWYIWTASSAGQSGQRTPSCRDTGNYIEETLQG